MLAIVGPTGSGKSHLAIFLAERLGGEIVNCDSVQVYRGLDIGSAKTPPEERRGIPHHLFDIAPATEEVSAGAYARLARPVIKEIQSRGRLPVIAGGTGFYLRALLEGLSPAPGRDEALRTRLQILENRFSGFLHRYLRHFDPQASERIHPNDLQKLTRAIELTRLSRRPASDVQRIPREAMTGVTPFLIGLNPDRDELYSYLNRRSEQLFQRGILEETKQVLQTLPDPAHLPRSLGALGYKQAVRFLMGDASLSEAISETQTRTRQYAKRQLTWFRSNEAIHWLPGFGEEPAIQAQALELITNKQ